MIGSEQWLSRREDSARLFLRRLLLLALLLVIVFLARGVWGIYQKGRVAKANQLAAAARLSELKDQRAKLQGNISKLKSDRGVEEVLREQYELGKTGEGLIVIVDRQQPTTTPKPSFPSVEWFRQFWP